MKPFLATLALTLTACGIAQAQVPPDYARPAKQVPGQVPSEPKYTAAGANDEIKAVLKAQTEVIKALAAKVDALEARLAKIEAERK